MANILFISVNDINAHGTRMLSAALKSSGHESSILFFKRPGFPYTFYHEKYWEAARKIRKNDWIGINENGVPYQYSRGPEITSRENELLASLVKRINPDMIGFSVTAPLMEKIADITAFLKKNFNIPVIWGGAGATIDPETCVNFCDFVCIGEGDKVIIEIADRIDNKQDIFDVNNLCRISGGGIVCNPLYPLIQNLDELPFPDILPKNKYLIEDDTLIENFSEITYSNRYHVMGSRGCPFNCSYCTESYYKKLYSDEHFMRRRSPQSIVNELKEARKITDFQIVQFEDEIFSLETKWLEEYKDLYINEINLPFSCYIYPRRNLDRQLIILKEAGLFDTCLSLQSGSERINKEIFHRPFKKENFFAAARKLKSMGIIYYTDIITYNPFETEADLKETLDVLLNASRPDPVYINKLYILKNTAIAKLVDSGHNRHSMDTVPLRLFDYYVQLFLFSVSEGRYFVQFIQKMKLFRLFPRLLRNPKFVSAVKSLTGISLFSKSQLDIWRQTLENRRDWLKFHGIRYLFLLTPARHSGIKRKLINYFSVDGNRAKSDQLLEYFYENSKFGMLDLRETDQKNGTVIETVKQHVIEGFQEDGVSLNAIVFSRALKEMIPRDFSDIFKQAVYFGYSYSHQDIQKQIEDSYPSIVIEERDESLLSSVPELEMDIVEDLFNFSLDSCLKVNKENDYAGLIMMNQLSADSNPDGLVLKSKGSDPHFGLPAFDFQRTMPLIFKIVIDSPEETYLQLFYCTRSKPYYNESQSLQTDLKKGINKCFVQLLPRDYVGPIRIDPGKIPGDFILHEIEVRSQSVIPE